MSKKALRAGLDVAGCYSTELLHLRAEEMESTETIQPCSQPAVAGTKAGLKKPEKALVWLLHYLHLTFPHALRSEKTHCSELHSKWASAQLCKSQLGLKRLISHRLASCKAIQMSPRCVPIAHVPCFFLMREIPQTSITYNNRVVKITDSYISIKAIQNATPPCFWTRASN